MQALCLAQFPRISSCLSRLLPFMLWLERLISPRMLRESETIKMPKNGALWHWCQESKLLLSSGICAFTAARAEHSVPPPKGPGRKLLCRKRTGASLTDWPLGNDSSLWEAALRSTGERPESNWEASVDGGKKGKAPWSKNREYQLVCLKDVTFLKTYKWLTLLATAYVTLPLTSCTRELEWFNYTHLRTEMETVRELTKVSPLVISRNRTKSACIKECFCSCFPMNYLGPHHHCSSNVPWKLVCKKIMTLKEMVIETNWVTG